MEILNVIRNRYSVRHYQQKEIEEEKLNRILEAGRLAPSARNIQEWRFIVVTDPLLKKSLSLAANNQTFISECSAIIVCCAVVHDYKMRCGELAYPIDVAIAIDHMALQAVFEGLGTCWIGSFYPEKVRPILNIPEKIPVVEMLAVGYPLNDTVPHKSRLPLEKLFSKNRWEKHLETDK